MSITVKLWNQAELESLKTDKWLATIFMNGKTFSANEMRYYPYNSRRTYVCTWYNDEPVTIYATDERMLLKFIKAEYTRLPDEAYQIIHQYKPVKLS